MKYRPVSKHVSRPKKVDPFKQGLDKDVVLRLIEGKHTKQDRAKYYRTQWYKDLVQEAVDTIGWCLICGAEKGLTWHHNKHGYKRMFAERFMVDGCLVCKRCHQRVEGKL